MKSSTRLAQESNGILILNLMVMTIRAYKIPARIANALKQKAQLDAIDSDDLYALTEKYRDSELTVWSGEAGSVDASWKGRPIKLDASAAKSRHRAIDFTPRGTELLVVEHDFVTYRTELLSPFKPSQLRVNYKCHRLDKTFRWMSSAASYGAETFDEYRWEDGSRPEFIGRNSDANFLTAWASRGKLSMSRLG